MICTKPTLSLLLHSWDSSIATELIPSKNFMMFAICVPCIGVTFAAELIMSWNVAFVATRNLRKRIVLKRRNIAHFYIWHSTFIFDTISTLVFIIQVLLLLIAFLKPLCMHVTLQHIACLLLAHLSNVLSQILTFQ